MGLILDDAKGTASMTSCDLDIKFGSNTHKISSAVTYK